MLNWIWQPGIKEEGAISWWQHVVAICDPNCDGCQTGFDADNDGNKELTSKLYIRPLQTKSGALWLQWSVDHLCLSRSLNYSSMHYNCSCVGDLRAARAKTFNITSTRVLCWYNATASRSAGYHTNLANFMLTAAKLHLHLDGNKKSPKLKSLTQMYASAKFQLHIPNTFVVTTLQSSSTRKIDLYSKH